MGNALEKVKVLQIYDIQSMVKELEALLSLIGEEQQREVMERGDPGQVEINHKPILIVVDSIGSLLSPMLGGQGYDAGQSMLVATAMYLSLIHI